MAHAVLEEARREDHGVESGAGGDVVGKDGAMAPVGEREPQLRTVDVEEAAHGTRLGRRRPRDLDADARQGG
jgi:hypothetical protein